MDWLNIHGSTLDHQAFVGSEPVARATWLCLMRFCAGQENGGTIMFCGDWGDRKWQQLCRVTLDEVKMSTELWHWDATSLVVHFYPKEKEREVQVNRENGNRGGRPKEQKEKPPGYESVNQVVPNRRNGREGKGKEEEGEARAREASAATPSDYFSLRIRAVIGSKLDSQKNRPGYVRLAATYSEDDIVTVAESCLPDDRWPERLEQALIAYVKSREKESRKAKDAEEAAKAIADMERSAAEERERWKAKNKRVTA